MKQLPQLLEIIRQKGIGEYLGLCETNLETIENYPQYVQMSLAPENKKYFVELLTHKSFSYPDKQLYVGYGKKTAEEIFNKAVENGRGKIKETKLCEKLGVN